MAEAVASVAEEAEGCKFSIYGPIQNEMRTICCIVAMMEEATPFINEFGLRKREGFFAPLPCQMYDGEVGTTRLCLVSNGQQHGSDLVGCEAASVATMATIQRLNPDIVINIGTCGAFKTRGAEIGKVYLGNCAMFHDRRVPGDDAWNTQSIGNYPVWEGSEKLAATLSLPMAKVTTGSSLDMQPCDLKIIQEHGGELKDMEGAAIGFVCSLFHKPVVYVKSVTDLCDGGAKTIDEFRQNLSKASEELRKASKRIIEALCVAKL